jgi:protein-S-isoprenylcysteine O-methyltransferase Ste14
MEPTPNEAPVADAAPVEAVEVARVPESTASAPPELGVDTGLLIVVAAIVTSVVQGLKRSGALRLVPSRWIPVVSVGLAIAGAAATSLTNGHSLTQSLVEGVLAGLSATGLYELGKPRPAQASDETA